MRALAFALVACMGCGNSPQSIAVTLRVPAGEKPLALADGVSLSVRDSSGAVIAVAHAPSGAASLALDGVPAAAGYTVELDAQLGTDVVARGRSCPFDVVAGRPAPPVPVYFSRVGAFAAAGNPLVARAGAAGFAAGPGAILAGGSAAGGAPLASSDQYDHASGRFLDGPTLNAARAGAGAATLPGGGVLIFGGAAVGSTGVELFATGKFAPAASAFPPDLDEQAAASLGDGRVLVCGGRLGSGPARADALLVTLDGALVVVAAPLARPRARHTLTLAAGARAPGAFVIGGLDATGPVADVELFDPSSDGFSLPGAQLATPRYDHTATLLADGRILIAGGHDAGGQPLDSAEIFDPVRRAFAPTGRLKTARAQHTATPLASGRVLIAGGLDAGGAPLTAAEIFDPALGPAGDFVPTAPLTTARAAHAAIPLCDGTLLISGGGPGADVYNPAP